VSFASPDEALRHRNIYLKVFGALAALTAVTVAVAMIGLKLHWSTPAVIIAALFVASIKGSLVACYFMHLLTERKALFVVLGFCVFFFFVLLLYPMMTDQESAAEVLRSPSVPGAAEHSGH